MENVIVQWYSRKLSSPGKGRILVFSPVYPEGHEMRIRIIDGQFFRHTTDATHWAYLPQEPNNERS